MEKNTAVMSRLAENRREPEITRMGADRAVLHPRHPRFNFSGQFSDSVHSAGKHTRKILKETYCSIMISCYTRNMNTSEQTENEGSDAPTNEPPSPSQQLDPAERIRAVRAEVEKVRPDGEEEGLSSTLAEWLVMQLTVAAHRATEKAGEEGLSLDTLRKLSGRVCQLRKGDQDAARVEVACERLEIQRQGTRERMEEQFNEWLDQPEIMKRFRPEPPMTYEESQRRIREVFGITHPPLGPDPDDAEPQQPKKKKTKSTPQ